MRLRFPKSARLTHASEFGRLKRDGTTTAGRYMIFNVLAGLEGSPRLGIITTRKVGGAVVRNRIRRQIRELFRKMRPQLRPGVWLVIIARHRAAGVASSAMQEEWLSLARRAGILQTP